MERYLPKIYSNFFEYDPLSNVDFTETYTRQIDGNSENEENSENSGTSKNTGTSNSSSENSASGLNVNSDTPQGQISKTNILNGSYASSTGASETESNITDETSTSSTSTSSISSSSSSSGTSKTIETFTRHQEGDNGVIITNQRLVKEYREIIIAIDEEIINELNSLFMCIY